MARLFGNDEPPKHLTPAEIEAQAKRLAGTIELKLLADENTRAKLLEIYGLWSVIARMSAGRVHWEGILWSCFPDPTPDEVQKSVAEARKRLGI